MYDVLLVLARLACPVGMGVMMWMMMRGQRRENPPAAVAGPVAPTAADLGVAPSPSARQEVS